MHTFNNEGFFFLNEVSLTVSTCLWQIQDVKIRGRREAGGVCSGFRNGLAVLSTCVRSMAEVLTPGSHFKPLIRGRSTQTL